MNAPKKAAVSWSGGKDAALAWRTALAEGWDVRSFVTMLKSPGESLSHHLPRAWLQRQVQACGVAWWPVEVPQDGPGDYAAAFDAVLQRLRAQGHAAMVFGDIDLRAHRDWLQARCEAAGLQAVFPLWGRPRAEVARAIVDGGFRATLVAVDLTHLAASFCGRAYDDDLLRELPTGVCPCGEDGEFHTALQWAPGMAEALDLPVERVEIVPSAPPLRPTRIARLVLKGA